MRAGRLDTRITIEQPSESQDAYGEVDQTWSTLATVWAEVYPMSGSESFKGQQVFAEDVLVFRIRHRSDVTRKMRIDHGGTKYDIEVIAEPRGTRSEVLEITAKARAV